MRGGSYIGLIALRLVLVLTLYYARTRAQEHQDHRQFSQTFTYESFKCPANPCPKGITMLHSAYVHMVVGTDHASVFPLLVHRICDFFKQCINPSKIRIVLHSKVVSSNRYIQLSRFLRSLSIQPVLWNGTFTADTKMAKSFESLRGIHSHDTIILQMDVDEEPDLDKFNQALSEIEAQKCDAVFAYWQDRLAIDGNLSAISIDSEVHGSLQNQFPLRCQLSGRVVKGGKTTKTIAYRADTRLDGGQHDVWCDRNGGDGRIWNKTLACRTHAHDRAKSRYLPLVLANIPNMVTKPKYCPTKVPLFHYKFVHGVEEYLLERMRSYKALGLHWWKDSRLFVEHIREHGGKVCVRCNGMRCVDTTTGKRVQEEENSAF